MSHLDQTHPASARLKVRWSQAVIQGLLSIVLIGPLLGWATGWSPLVIPVLLVFVALIARGTRRCTLVLTENGFTAQYPAYELSGRWDDALEVRRARQGLFRRDQIVFRATDWKLTRQLTERQTARLQAHNRKKSLSISLFQRKWRDGPAGHALRARGIQTN